MHDFDKKPIELRGVQKCLGGSTHFSKISSYGSIFFEKFGPGGPDLGGSKSGMTVPWPVLVLSLIPN